MKLILASSSPRRKDILNLFDIDYKIITPDGEENYILNSTPIVNTMTSSFLKANYVINNLKDKEDIVVLSADTIVLLDNEIMGKPKDMENHIKMIENLSGKTHEVITGYSLVSKDKKIVDYTVTKVKFKELDQETIINYCKDIEGKDKAGGYAIQGKATVFVDTIIGDYRNAIGLPISQIYDKLKNEFNLDLLKK